MNEGGQFKFKVGQLVWYQPEVRGKLYVPYRVRIMARTIEPALGKTYMIRSPKRSGTPFVREAELSSASPTEQS